MAVLMECLIRKLFLNVVKTLKEAPNKVIKSDFFLRLEESMDSIDFGTVITTTENEETQRRESQQGNVNEKEHFSKFKILLKKLKSFYCAPVTKFWFNVVGSCFNICPYIKFH